MINLKQKYMTYIPGEFLPIYIDGKLSNAKEFHFYKLKRAALKLDRAFADAIDRAYSR